jgi:hypothetical protein
MSLDVETSPSSDVIEKQALCKTVTESFLYSMPRVRFNFSDIDAKAISFYDRLEAEVESIYGSPRARKGRTKFSIRDSSFRGMVAEGWYIQNQPFPGSLSWTDVRWHDIMINESKYPSFNGDHIEVKTVSSWNYRDILNKVDSAVWAVWNTSSFISVFLTNWDQERDLWFKNVKSTGAKGTFVDHVKSGASNVWWEYFGTKCIDPSKKVVHKHKNVDI